MRRGRGFVLPSRSGVTWRARAMWKAIVAGTAALAIAGTSLAYAQERVGRDGMVQGRQLNADDLRAFGEARLAALKAGLMLTPEQEKNWPAFEQAARDLAKARMERISAMRNAPANNDPVERLRQRATALSETGTALHHWGQRRFDRGMLET